jgi:LysR family nitrogen assimilation transcriptional regulator
MDLRTLELFLSIAATNSFSRSAALAGLTQSSVSKSIAALEAELAVRLFERTGRGAVLSPEGRALLPRIDAMVREARSLRDVAGTTASEPAGTVEIAAQPSVGWALFSRLLGVLRQDYPLIRLQISEGTTNTLEDWLADGRIAMAVMSRPPSPRYAESTWLTDFPMYLIARADNPHAQSLRKRVPFRVAAGLPLIMSAAPNGSRLILEEEARRQGLTVNVRQEVNSFYLIKRMLRGSDDFSVTTYKSVEEELASGELLGRPIVQPVLRQGFYLGTALRRAPTQASRIVQQLIIDWAAAQPESQQPQGDMKHVRA